jgi:hypothetical protein
MDRTQYSVSSPMPTSAEVVGSDYDARTNAFTGLPTQRFAKGGLPLQQNVQAPLDIAINPQTDQRQIVAPIQLPVAQQAPQQVVPDPNQFSNMFNQLQAQTAAVPRPSPTAQVLDYSRILNQRANDEYVNSPTPAAFRAAPPMAPQAAVPEAPAITQDINGLYQYYLGRQPTADEAGQYKYGSTVTPEEAADFRQYTGAELANSGYKPTGPDPFMGQNMGSLGLPRFGYNAATKSYSPMQQAQIGQEDSLSGYDPAVLQAMYADYQNRMNSQNSGGGAAGGMMPGALKYAMGGATGYNLGGYSDGGRLLKGPGDGMSDNIPASIADKQPARLADGEFVVPADVVSHLGNGSTDAGAKKLYSMMDNVRKARTGNKKQGKQIKAEKYLKA